MPDNQNQVILNPYEILGVSPSASKSEIVAAKVAAMKRKQYPINVLAEAERSLLKSEKRIIADYTRPTLPPVKRFKRENLKLLDSLEPSLKFLSQFDGLDSALNQSLLEETLEEEILILPQLELYQNGLKYQQQKQYIAAIKCFENFLQSCAQKQPPEYAQAQILLARIYQIQGELEKSLALCQQLINAENQQIATWAKNAVIFLLTAIQTQQEINKLEVGLQNFQQKNYLQAIVLLEEFCQVCTDSQSQNALRAKVALVQAYYGTKQFSKALSLCQQLRESNNLQVQAWANKNLQLLSTAKSNLNT
ncbi:MAG TPA: hypothetical protein VK184_05190 [Nostocaceae cyanobacterium]|nr:hypothetical protein [Nostocaceae cyanobacterium]